MKIDMEKYYFKTTGEEPDICCTEKCYSKKSTEGTMIGSVNCQQCLCCMETDKDEFENVSWIKCSDLKNAINQNKINITNVQKLQKIGILGDIRLRLGAEDEHDELYDDDINKLSNHEIISEWSAWNIGEKYWWEKMKTMFDELEKLK